MDYRDIGHIFRGIFDPGKLKIQEEGFYFKSMKSGRMFQIRESDIDQLEWMRVARGYEVKVLSKDGAITKFGGFKETDYIDLKNFFKVQYRKELTEVDLCVKGWNWGDITFKGKGSLLSFNVDSKPAFEVPLNEVSKVTSGKNEVIMEFHMSDDSPLSLVEMRFHVPHTNPVLAQDEAGENVEQESIGPDPVKELHDKILAKADVIQATGDAIVTFAEIHCLTPRGRYSIKIFPSFLQLHGKTYDYKIPHKSVTRLFLLPHNDQRQMLFVIQLDPPLRQGQTRYYFVILSLPTEEDCDVTLALSDEEIKERYGESTKISREMSGSFYEIFSRVMKVFIGKRVTIPESFKSKNNQCAIACSYRATSGYLYPLDKGFIFVHKPAMYIKFDGIASVNFARMSGSAGVSRSFDFEVEMKDGNAHHFSSLMKEDYDRLSQFVSDKKLRVKSKVKVDNRTLSYKDDASSDSDHDAYLQRVMAEGEDRDSEDEDSDFVADKSGSDDDLEYDSEAKISDDDENVDEKEQQSKSKKRKANPKSTKPPAKKRKEDSGGNKRTKAKKDPNAPKKPMTPFMLWLKDNRSKIKEDNPGISVIDVGKKAGVLWKMVSSTEKKQYEDLAAKAKKQYQQELAEYQSSGAATAFLSKSSKSPAKKAKMTDLNTVRMAGTGSSKIKSAEFVQSDEDVSSDDGEPSEGEDVKGTVRTRRSNAGDAQLVSLPSDEEGESEVEAELTSESEESESD